MNSDFNEHFLSILTINNFSQKVWFKSQIHFSSITFMWRMRTKIQLLLLLVQYLSVTVKKDLENFSVNSNHIFPLIYRRYRGISGRQLNAIHPTTTWVWKTVQLSLSQDMRANSTPLQKFWEISIRKTILLYISVEVITLSGVLNFHFSG